MHLTQEEFEKEASKAMAVKLFEMKRISSGTAAALLDMDRVQFIMMLKDYGVSYINVSPEEFISDLED